MKQLILLSALFLTLSISGFSQIAINTDGSVADDNAMLDVESNNKGFLLPRVDLDNVNTVAPLTGTVTKGMIIYNEGGDAEDGLYIWNGSEWKLLLVQEVDGSVTNEIQDLSLSGNILSLSDDATTVDLSGYLDDQTVTITAGDGITITGTYPNFTVANTPYSGSIYRWATFSTYNQPHGWYANNSSTLFGGITPSTWSDNNGIAANMSSDKQILLALFSRKGYAGKNAMVYAEEWYSYSSTNGKFAAALFRIENTTGSAINWVVDWYCTAYSGWGERASITVNGADNWNSGTNNYGANHHETITLSIPANRKSTVIFVSGSSRQTGTRGVFLGFDNDCLELPVGLKYIDDLNTAPNGWNN
ncbi:MAG: hypothetical protein K8R58_07535 [Bacteroidales bacterium]|nr:hypothetical protein [Bacteroidales bacterium]